jgi:hypothetical protein
MDIEKFIKSITREKNLSRMGEKFDESLVEYFDIIDNATSNMIIMDDESIKTPGLIYGESENNKGTFVYHELTNDILFHNEEELEETLSTCPACINEYGNFEYELRQELLIEWVCKKFETKKKPTGCFFPKIVSETITQKMKSKKKKWWKL